MKKILVIIFCFSFSIFFSQGSCFNFSTYFGKLAQDEIRGVCLDNQNNSYIIGTTTNTDLPVTSGAFQSNLKGGDEAFIAKFDSCGNLVWCTYLGTSGFDSGEKISFSSDNTIVFCGYTNGTDLSATSGCFQSSSNGDYDCFIGKFSLNGNPIWLSYFGASAADLAYDIKTDALNNIVIGGTSLSNSLYTNASSFQQNIAGQTDAFIARFRANGSLIFSTFYGGSGSEDIHALAVDKNCNIIGTGGSFSSNLSTTPGCFQPSSNGGMEIYVIKLDSIGQRVFSTYIGGNSIDDAFGAASDNSNNIYVSGYSSSTNFFTSAGAYQPTNAGGNDGYCLKLDPSGIMVWSTFLGGTGSEISGRLCMNGANELAVFIESQSTDFPMLGTNNFTLQSGGSDAVLIKLTDYGTPFWSTYIGGSGGEIPHDMAVSGNKKIVLAGLTASGDFPVGGNVYQSTNAGFQDGFLAVYQTPLNPATSVSENQKECEFTSNIITLENEIILEKVNCFFNATFFIYDLLGKKMKSGSILTDRIDISDLTQGVFFFTIESEKGTRTTLKFVRDR